MAEEKGMTEETDVKLRCEAFRQIKEGLSSKEVIDHPFIVPVVRSSSIWRNNNFESWTGFPVIPVYGCRRERSRIDWGVGGGLRYSRPEAVSWLSSFCWHFESGKQHHIFVVFLGSEVMNWCTITKFFVGRQDKPFQRWQHDKDGAWNKRAFFKLIEPRYSFPQSLQCGIMKYSSGAPGVFGLLIRFTVDNDSGLLSGMNGKRGSKWVHFPVVQHHRIQGDLRSLTELEWEAHLKTIGQRRLVDPLLRMGIVVQGSSGELAIVSEMMCRVCVEIHQAANTDDPVLLFVYPKTISNHLVKNRQAPSESAFHHEQYSTIGDVLKQGALTRGIYAEVKTSGSRRRADILIANGVRVAQISYGNPTSKSPQKQADEYRQQFNVDRMLVVNLDTRLDEVYRFTRSEGSDRSCSVCRFV
ncbi:TPA: LOW QUALITY PROTEIN: hypothetical protein N0F65_001235 [Lagenidium giganteum]|uniref:Uncharacterized protein n=1 Tax=Lagenidium giganteum TaxID=4803 RepID=A0AAV2Z5V4_9STRA|nr:TPA: LOW QUALITY PROTEIN: hypothetical protein N0F65_001235 [Lagenidium giganteum]